MLPHFFKNLLANFVLNPYESALANQWVSWNRDFEACPYSKPVKVLSFKVRTIKTKSRFISDGNTCAWLAGILLAGVVVVGAMGVAARTKTGTEEPGDDDWPALGGRTRSSKDNGGDHGGPAAANRERNFM